MPEMIYGQTIGINVPAGWYECRFKGTEERPDMEGSSQYGKEGVMQPRMAWVWEITAGPHAGELLPQETGTTAVLKSEALRMLHGLNNGPFPLGHKVRTEDFIGRSYRLKVAVNPRSDKNRLHIADIEVLTSAPHAPAKVAAQPPRPPARPAAPPRPPAPAAPPVPAARKFFAVDSSGEVVGPVLEHEIQTNMDASSTKPGEYMICLEGTEEWKTAEAFGFTSQVPY